MNIIFFDDDCSYCNRYINFLISIDKNNSLFFSSIKSDSYADLLKNSTFENIDSILFSCDGCVYIYSDAIIKIFEVLGYKVNFLFYIPPIIRDSIYKLFAKYRKSFNKDTACKIPDATIRYKFLDL